MGRIKSVTAPVGEQMSLPLELATSTELYDELQVMIDSLDNLRKHYVDCQGRLNSMYPDAVFEVTRVMPLTFHCGLKLTIKL